MTMLHGMQTWRLATAAGVAALALSAAPTAAEISFAGKTVTLLVNFAAGSSTDVAARMVQPFLARHLPGSPTLIVVNKPGAGGVNAAAHFYATTPPDGTTLGLFATLPAQVLASTDRKKFRFDIEKFGWVGAISTVSILLTAPNAGIVSADDLKGRRDPIFLAAPTARGPNTVMGQLIFGLLGSPYKVVTGYRGQPGAVAAVERGEATAGFLNVNVYVRRRASFDQAGVRGILQAGYQGADGMSVGAPGIDLPEADAVLRRLASEKIGTPEYRTYRALRVGSTLAQNFLLPPGASAETLRVMRRAVEQAISDPGFKAAVEKSRALPVNFMPGEAGLTMLKAALVDIDTPETRAVLRRVLGDK